MKCLVQISKVDSIKTIHEQIIIVGVQTKETDQDFEYSLKELVHLIENAHGQVVGELLQKRDAIDTKTMIGKGKVQELKKLVDETQATTVVFNQELTPSQVRNLQEEVDAKVIDRIQVILDIFALRAKSKEGRLQVSLAQLEYMLPRLVGQGINMSRLGGGIGTRGPGETKLETDRRHVLKQMTDIKRELKKSAAHRQRSRENRQSSNLIQIGLIGYTNAGKSTLLNQLTQAQTFEKDLLFATLDPLARQFDLPNGMKVTLTDTVGFIQDLPTQLIESFKSTFEETKQVDLLLHIIDASDPNIKTHEDTVLNLIDELDMGHIPRLTIYNKTDIANENFVPAIFPNIKISATNSSDLEELQELISKELEKIMVYYEHVIPSDRGDILNQLHLNTIVKKEKFDEDKQVYSIKGFSKKDSKWSKDQIF